MAGITATPEKLQLLSENFDPRPLFSIIGQTGGAVAPSDATQYPSAYQNFMLPQTQQKPAPQLTPQMLSAFMPKQPSLPPAAGLAANPSLGPMAKFQGARIGAPSYSQILGGR